MQPKVEKAKQSVDHPKPTAVFRLIGGTELFAAPRVYIARPMDDIDIEFPAQPEDGSDE